MNEPSRPLLVRLVADSEVLRVEVVWNKRHPYGPCWEAASTMTPPDVADALQKLGWVSNGYCGSAWPAGAWSPD